MGARSRRKQTSKDVAEAADTGVRAGLARAMAQVRGAASLPSRRTEAIELAIHAIEAALYGVDDIRGVLEEICAVALAAQESDDEAGRALLAERYDDLRLAIEALAEEAEYEGAQLLGRKATALDVDLGGRAKYIVSPARMTLSERGLDLPPPHHAFADAEEVQLIIEKVDAALSRIDRVAEVYCRDGQALSQRLADMTCAELHKAAS